MRSVKQQSLQSTKQSLHIYHSSWYIRSLVPRNKQFETLAGVHIFPVRRPINHLRIQILFWGRTTWTWSGSIAGSLRYDRANRIFPDAQFFLTLLYFGLTTA